jgi:hypothetical protein
MSAGMDRMSAPIGSNYGKCRPRRCTACLEIAWGGLHVFVRRYNLVAYPFARSSRPRSRSQLRFFSVSRLS